MSVFGGVDLGGTKIEAAVFDADWTLVKSRRCPTPQTSYGDLVAALSEQVNWIKAAAGTDHLPIGVGIPGIVDAASGRVATANLPATGHRLPADLIVATGHELVFEKDCNCFALSEALQGAGVGYASVFGLILGTGVAGGICLGGRLIDDLSGASGEVGHLGIPAALASELGLPIVTCGCGRQGCFETVASGPGMARLARHFADVDTSPEDIIARAAGGDRAMGKVLAVWLKITAELIGVVHKMLDPQCIVLGGGLSNIENLPRLLLAEIDAVLFEGARRPAILCAGQGNAHGARGTSGAHGTSGVCGTSGARGAALVAMQQAKLPAAGP